MTKDAIKRDMDLLKFAMTRTSGNYERQNLAALGIELTAMYLQACGYFMIPSEPGIEDENVNMIAPFDHPKKVRKGSKEKAQRNKTRKQSIFVKYNGY